MIKLLPFILIPVLIIGVLGYWRFSASSKNLTTPQTESDVPIEVPKTLPQASLEDRVKALEEVVNKLVAQVNNLKAQPSPASSANSSSSNPNDLDSQVTQLKVRVSALEKATPAPVSGSSKYPLYIPLGSSAGPWSNQDWVSASEYETVIDPGNYANYTSMQLEVNFRLIETAGTGSVRLYNASDNSAISSQVDTTSSSFSLKTSSTFTLPSGSKTYKLQTKSSQGKDLYIQSARIKVNF
ncbi:hypothetical protein HYW41_03100 [Candidatus Daviesbacteria bacterium]|nr:hypothetical protein [Candidatus Daviesbacteria bacterium]